MCTQDKHISVVKLLLIRICRLRQFLFTNRCVSRECTRLYFPLVFALIYVISYVYLGKLVIFTESTHLHLVIYQINPLMRSHFSMGTKRKLHFDIIWCKVHITMTPHRNHDYFVMLNIYTVYVSASYFFLKFKQ